MAKNILIPRYLLRCIFPQSPMVVQINKAKVLKASETDVLKNFGIV